jgi:colanic acid biosynthesis glycosyl transferase WcaI
MGDPVPETAADSERLDVLVISIYYAPDKTGIAPYTAALARGLVERGHRVRAVVGYPHYPQWKIAEGYRGLRRREIIDGVEVVRVRHPVPRNSTGLGRIAMEAVFAAHAGTVRGRRPDVVLAASPSLLSVAAALTWRRPGRTAVGVIVQDVYCRALTETGNHGRAGAGAVARVERGLLARADGVSVIHDRLGGVLTDIGVDPATITVIRNWSHIAEPVLDRDATRTRLGWRDDELIALHSGNMGEKQGLDNVIDAARLADAAGVPVRFVLLGHGSRRPALEVAGAGVQRLQFVDPVPADAFPDVLAAADVLVLNEKPGVAEMCVPSKLTSYFAAGRPVVAAVNPDGGSSQEMHASGAGICVPAGRPQELLDAVLRTGCDPAGAQRAGARGQAYAREVLSAADALDSYEAWAYRLAAARHDQPLRLPWTRSG